MELHDYQQDGVNLLRAAFAAGKRAPLYVLPTGGGKTVTFSYIAASAVARGHRVMILVHRQELLLQVSRTLSAFDILHGFVAAGRRSTNYSERAYVASVQTVARRIKAGAPLPEIDLLIVDEAHHAIAKTWADVSAHYQRAAILGVTATPIRTDGKPLGDAFDCMIQGPTVAELIERGRLARPETYAPPVQLDMAGIRKREGDWNANQAAAVMDKPKLTGDIVDHFRRLSPDARAVAFCCSLKHAESLAVAFRAAGINAARIDGAMDNADRRQLVREFERGAVQVLTSVDLIGEGFDVPAIETAILARPTLSVALHLQQCGRALRVFDGKARALILDHAGNTARHGLVETPRDWSLDGSNNGRPRTGSGASISVVTCSACFAAYQGQACPYCGTPKPEKPREVETVAGELVKIEQAKAAAELKRAMRTERARAGTLADLIELGKRRGYKNPRFWAEQVLRGRNRV